MSVIDGDTVIGTMGEYADLIIAHMVHHKSYCSDITNCHVYKIIADVVSELMQKNVDIEEKP